jgi:hypothetical protein
MEANEGCVSGSYISEADNGTENQHAIAVHRKNDLLFFHLPVPEQWETGDWARIKHELPCFGKRGVGHIALEVDQHWYEFRHSDARAQLRSAAHPRPYDRTFVHFLMSIQPMWNGVDWWPHGWVSWNWDTITCTEHVWLVDCEIRRRGAETPCSSDVSDRRVFRGSGCRYVEVRKEDAGIWDFHWGYGEKDKPE